MNRLLLLVLVLLASPPAHADEVSEIRSLCEKDHPGIWNYFDRSECIRKAKRVLRDAEEQAKREQREVEAKSLRESRARPCIAEDLKRMEGSALQARYKLEYGMKLEDAQSALEPILGSNGEVVVADDNIREKIIIYTVPTKCDSAFRLLLNVRVDGLGWLKTFGVWPLDAPQGYDDKATADFRADFYQEHLQQNQQQWAREQKARQATLRRARQSSLPTSVISAAGSSEQEPSSRSAGMDGGDDPCAPDLSRKERLARLAKHGTIRQISDGRYVAGNHDVWFAYGANLFSCR